jgi:tetratricopeptide (TPR) repeat protein
MITDRIEAHFRGSPLGAAANMPYEALRVIERLVEKLEPKLTAEIGCGVSTILLGAMSARHTVYADDDRGRVGSAVAAVLACPLVQMESLRFAYGEPQTRIGQVPTGAPLDVVLIGGDHPLPSPVIEFIHLAERLRSETGLLVLDNVQLPHVRRLYSHLLEDPAFVQVGLAGRLACFRRAQAPLRRLAADWGEAALETADLRTDEFVLLRELAEAAASRGTTDLERAQLLGNLARANLVTGDVDRAERAARDALALLPDDAVAYDALARVAAVRDGPAAASPFRRWASLLAPNNAGIRLDLAGDLARQGRFADAEQALLDLLAGAPGHRDALALLGDLTAVQGRAADARLCREKEAEPGPEGAVPLYVAGEWLEFRQDGKGIRHPHRGWQFAEGWGSWSRGADSSVAFTLDPEGTGPDLTAVLELLCAASHVTAGFAPTLHLRVNDVPVGMLKLAPLTPDMPMLTYALRFDADLLRSGSANIVRFLYRMPLMPALTGGSRDPRLIGFSLAAFRLRFEPKPAPTPEAPPALV